MRQLWLADTVAKTTGLTPGEHRGELVLQAVGSSGELITQRCPVALQITSAVSAVPAQFFFGNVKPNETATKSIKIFFSPDVVPKDKNDIRFDHNLGDSLKMDWINTESDSWELQASLKLSDTAIPDEPMVTMIFSNKSLPRIKFPVYVMTSAESEP